MGLGIGNLEFGIGNLEFGLEPREKGVNRFYTHYKLLNTQNK